jgi:hypothetical protein
LLGLLNARRGDFCSTPAETLERDPLFLWPEAHRAADRGVFRAELMAANSTSSFSLG